LNFYIEKSRPTGLL